MNKKNGKRSSLIILVLLLLVGLTSAYVASTYAKYTEELTGNEGTAVVAKWTFGEDNDEGVVEIELDEEYDPANLMADRIAPGTSGKFVISLQNVNTETGIQYTITLGQPTNVPANLIFTVGNEGDPLDENVIQGTLPAKNGGDDEDSYKIEVLVNWEWPYETTNGDTVDTQAGMAGSTITLPISITGTQVQPE